MGGHLIHTLGANVTFRAAATGSFIVALIFAATQWKWKREDLDDSLGIYNYFSSGEPKDSEALLKGDLDEVNKLKNHRKAEAKHKHKQKQDKKQIR